MMANFKINIKVETPEKLSLDEKTLVLHNIRAKLEELNYSSLKLNVTKEVTDEELLNLLL